MYCRVWQSDTIILAKYELRIATVLCMGKTFWSVKKTTFMKNNVTIKQIFAPGWTQSPKFWILYFGLFFSKMYHLIDFDSTCSLTPTHASEVYLWKSVTKPQIFKPHYLITQALFGFKPHIQYTLKVVIQILYYTYTHWSSTVKS